jgi:hypothetical protein
VRFDSQWCREGQLLKFMLQSKCAAFQGTHDYFLKLKTLRPAASSEKVHRSGATLWLKELRR